MGQLARSKSSSCSTTYLEERRKSAPPCTSFTHPTCSPFRFYCVPQLIVLSKELRIELSPNEHATVDCLNARDSSPVFCLFVQFWD